MRSAAKEVPWNREAAHFALIPNKTASRDNTIFLDDLLANFQEVGFTSMVHAPTLTSKLWTFDMRFPLEL